MVPLGIPAPPPDLPVFGGRFAALRVLGAGAHGFVYEVVDEVTGDRLALKTLRSPGDAEALELKREFRVLAHLRHANMARLYDLEADGGRSTPRVSPTGTSSRRTCWLMRGRVVILDLGAAMAFRSAERRRLAGSWPFCAPEEVQRGIVTPASDAYSVGVFLHCVLAWIAPRDYDGKSALRCVIVASAKV